MKPRILVIAGPTASGKSDLAISLAKQLDGEIVCADSLTVYRGFNIGSAKPTPLQRSEVPHHLIDIRDPHENFTAADFLHGASKAITAITERGRVPIVAGGTGLYIRTLLGGLSDAPAADAETRNILQQRAMTEGRQALFEELRKVDPASAEQCHPNNIVRIIRALEVWHTTGRQASSFRHEHGFAEQRYEHLSICLHLPRPELYSRIDRRVDAMLAAGLVEEVTALLESSVPADSKPLAAIGYKEVVAFLKGENDRETMADMIKQNTRNFAKRQITWFKKESAMHPVAYPENSDTIFTAAEKFLREGEKPDVQDPL